MAAVVALIPALFLALLALVPPLPAQAAGPFFGLPVPEGTCHIGCNFDGLGCYEPGLYHSAVDYVPNAGAVNVLATADGTVAALFTINDPDAAQHGMGNAVVLRHLLASGGVVFSLYGHLDHFDHAFHIGERVSQGAPVGVMGGSGFGQPTFWGTHVHFELKGAGVLGDPATGQYEGYTPTPAENWGYFDPNAYIGQVEFVPLSQEWVSQPSTPAGPGTTTTGQAVQFSSGGAACNWGHPVQYRFDWGDGQATAWQDAATASHAWGRPGRFTVSVAARCAEDTGVVSEAATSGVEVSGDPVDPPSGSSGDSGGGGCFIATAAWGAGSPEVWRLRRFRDACLSQAAPGRWFIANYYALSPPAARRLRENPALRPLVRVALLPLSFAAGAWVRWGQWVGWLALLAALWLGGLGIDAAGVTVRARSGR